MNLTTTLQGRPSGKGRFQKKLYAQFYGYVLKIAFRYLHDFERSTEVTNSTFVDIFQNTGYIEYGGDEKALKSFITKRTVMNVLKLYDRVVTNFAVSIGTDQMTLEALPPVNFDARLISHLGRLSPWHRTLLNMHVIDGFSLDEIAQHFRLTEQFCALQLQQARTLLRNLVTNERQLR
ncbi:MAG: RNA polymerase sigma factor [Flavisolibacter sp.]